MYEVGSFGAISSTLFVVIGIYMAHTLYESPRKWWQCVLAWLGAVVLVTVLGEVFAVILPQLSPERVDIFTGCAFVLVYLYIFPNIPLPQRIFTYFLVDNSQYLLVLFSRTIAMLLVGTAGADAQIAFAVCYFVCAAAFCVLYTVRLKAMILRCLNAFQKSLVGLTLFAVVCYLSTLLLIDVWGPWPALSVSTAMERFALLLINLSGYLLAFRTLTAVQNCSEAERDARQLAEQFTQSERYYDSMVEQIEQTRLRTHDLHHHITAISALCEGERWEQVRGYVANLAREMPRGLPKRYCNLDELNAVLDHYAHQCEQGAIAFDCRVELPRQTGIAPVHLCIILGNALENAVEASWAVNEERRFVNVSVVSAQSRVAISVTNRFDGYLKSGPDGQPCSIKEEPGHGLGLASIRETAQRYGGWCGTQIEGDVFTIQVTLECRN